MRKYNIIYIIIKPHNRVVTKVVHDLNSEEYANAILEVVFSGYYYDITYDNSYTRILTRNYMI